MAAVGGEPVGDPGPQVLALARGAVNFHDGPLPRYAGLNAPVWAILNGERQHGISWHLIEGGVDEGDVLESRSFDIAPQDTALTLNTRCFEAAMESFPSVSGTVGRRRFAAQAAGFEPAQPVSAR